MKCSLEVHEDVEDLYKLFISESLKSKRAECEIKKTDKLVFTITANDATAMKAFLNTILNSITVFNKTKAVLK